ncbi:MAG: AI-2E family transporter [Hyphomicrobiales bacterium]|nr:AI-2E family transporter [Hyphomicrobiales bacterium]
MPEQNPPAARPPALARPADSNASLTALFNLALLVVIVAGLYLAREVIIPITLAVLLAFVLAPVVKLLRHLGLWRVPSVLLAVLLSIAVVLGIAGLIGTQIADMASQVPRYETTIRGKVEAVRKSTFDRATALVSRWARQLEPAQTEQPKPASSNADTGPSKANPEQKPLPVEVHQPERSPLEIAESILTPVVSPLATLAATFVVAIFVLLQREDLRDRLISLFGSGDLHRTTLAMDDAAERLSDYLLALLGVNAGFGVIIGMGLFFIGVPSPILWAVLGALLRFIPYIGAPLSAIPALALASAVDPGWSMLLWTAALYVVVEITMSQAVEPLLYGHSTGLSPISVIVSATFWTWLWGPLGLILSTPLTLCLLVLGRHVDRLQFLDVALGDRPALTPVENFYQRMIAGDPDEALDQAELLLKERSLSAYYDEVALEGMKLAAHDVERGVIGPEKLEKIREDLSALIHELEVFDDSAPPVETKERDKSAPDEERNAPKGPVEDIAILQPEDLRPAWQGDTPVLCVCGRGPFDGTASAMLAQLLDKHGLGARVVSHAAISRSRSASFADEGAAMICVTYLEVERNLPHLRHLLRRLHQRLPKATVLVGLWSESEPTSKDERLRMGVSADFHAGSLRETIHACVTAATHSEEPKDKRAPSTSSRPVLTVVGEGQ